MPNFNPPSRTRLTIGAICAIMLIGAAGAALASPDGFGDSHNVMNIASIEAAPIASTEYTAPTVAQPDIDQRVDEYAYYSTGDQSTGDQSVERQSIGGDRLASHGYNSGSTIDAGIKPLAFEWRQPDDTRDAYDPMTSRSSTYMQQWNKANSVGVNRDGLAIQQRITRWRDMQRRNANC